MPLPPEFRVNETPDALRIEWDNRAVPRDRGAAAFFVVIWVFWTAATLGVTAWFVVAIGRFKWDLTGVFDMCFFHLWLIMAWTFVLLTPYILLGRTWGEAIDINREAITHTQTGWLAPKPTVYPLDRIQALAFGWYRNGPDAQLHGDSTYVSQVGLYVFWTGGSVSPCSDGVAYWVAPELKRELFERIRRFVSERDFPMKTAVWGDPPARVTDSTDQREQAN